MMPRASPLRATKRPTALSRNEMSVATYVPENLVSRTLWRWSWRSWNTMASAVELASAQPASPSLPAPERAGRAEGETAARRVVEQHEEELGKQRLDLRII